MRNPGTSRSGAAPAINPAALTPQDLAKLVGVSVDTIRSDIDAGAPINRDGTINLVYYAAWLNAPDPNPEIGTPNTPPL
ncbi:MAG: hypothetical protein GC159_17440 [Phycisphaera sp.]|nr:hypothetical protein [Phycisphaera sp.]